MRIKGFTLIELIVVIAIIAILAAIVAPNAFKAVEKAKVSGAIEDFRSIKTGAMAYYADLGSWPTTCTDPASCSSAGFITDTTGSTAWDGPYIEKWPQTGKWGQNVSFTSTAGAGSGIFNSTSNALERYINFTNVPWKAAQNLDKAIDGVANNSSGSVQYTNATTVNIFNILVSRDGAMD